MRTRRGKGSKFLFLISFLVASACLSAQKRIEWEPVSGADHYLVEIRQDGRLVFETRSEKPFIPLFLPPGIYDFRIKVIDTFGNVRTTGEPSRLEISSPLIPFIMDVFPRTTYEDAEPIFFARVSGLTEGREKSTSFELENSEDKRVPLSWEKSDSSKTAEGLIEIALSTRRKLPDAGIWHLIMANPDGREDRFENALNISQGSQARIRNVNPKAFVAGIPSAVLRIRVRDFDEDATLLIKGPSEIPVTKLNRGEDDFFEFNLILKNAIEGKYLISLVNSSGETDTARLRILSSETASSKEPKSLKIDNQEPRPLPEFPNAIYGGWRPIIKRIGSTGIFEPGSESFPRTEAVLQPSYLGFTLGYSRSIENSLLRRIPYLDGLEWFLSAGYTQSKLVSSFDIPSPEGKLDWQKHHSLAFLFGIAYTSWFDFPLNFLAQVGFGVGVTLRKYIGPSVDIPPLPSSIVQYEISTPENSTSFITSFDFGLRWDITPRLFVNATANAILRSDIRGYNEKSIQPKIEGGARW